MPEKARNKHRLLVLRFSALGDVALTLPVLNTFLQQYPDSELCVATRAAFAPLLRAFPRTEVVTADFRGVHRGPAGLIRLFRILQAGGPYRAVLDLHGVTRSRLLRFLFRLGGTPVFHIRKQRSRRRALTRKKNKVFEPLLTVQERYCEVFNRAAFPLAPLLPFTFRPDAQSLHKAAGLTSPPGSRRIGLAPFASYPLKEWGMEKIEVLCRELENRYPAFFLLFGFGSRELGLLRRLVANTGIKAHICDGADLGEQMALLASLECLISMDSANLHLGGLAGIPVVSVWGPTHPYAGFAPTGANAGRIVGIHHDELSCRPCSIYGNAACHRGDHACMATLAPEAVLDMVARVLG
jgi:ADP-heptose:LPS heptosyltransferase